MHRTSTPKTFKCNGYGSCEKEFSRAEHLSRHIRMHTGERPFNCTFIDCKKKFTRYDNMKQHRRTHDRNEDVGLRIRKKRNPRATCVTPASLPLSNQKNTIPSPDNNSMNGLGYRTYTGMLSPISDNSSPHLQLNDIEIFGGEQCRRRLSIADLCNQKTEQSSCSQSFFSPLLCSLEE
ncbi:hypothetical protein BDF14DRAFT_1804926 [Spinellus fusiger]|nr:hypothetical protein BDF14DRAFT_1804926 [Spinellus fusiger]